MNTGYAVVAGAAIVSLTLWFALPRFHFVAVQIGDREIVFRSDIRSGALCAMLPAFVRESYSAQEAFTRVLPETKPERVIEACR